MTNRSAGYLHGTLEVLILRALERQSRHGYGIARWIEEGTREVIQVEEGSLYPALYRMEKRDLIDSYWGTTELSRRAKFYQLTEQGRRKLERETREWEAFSSAVSRLLLPRKAETAQ